MSQPIANRFTQTATPLSLDDYKAQSDNLQRHSTQFYKRFKALLRRVPLSQRYEASMHTYNSTKGTYPHYGILMQALFALRHAPINDKDAALRELHFKAPFDTPFRSALERRVNALG